MSAVPVEDVATNMSQPRPALPPRRQGRRPQRRHTPERLQLKFHQDIDGEEEPSPPTYSPTPPGLGTDIATENGCPHYKGTRAVEQVEAKGFRARAAKRILARMHRRQVCLCFQKWARRTEGICRLKAAQDEIELLRAQLHDERAERDTLVVAMVDATRTQLEAAEVTRKDAVVRAVVGLVPHWHHRGP